MKRLDLGSGAFPKDGSAAWTFGRAINKVAEASPGLCSRVSCNWVGGFEEIEYRFAKDGG